MIEESKEHTIEEIEQKMKAARKAYVDYASMLGDRSLLKIFATKEEMKEKSFLKSQYATFNSVLKDMKNDKGGVGIKKGDIDKFISKLEQYTSAVAPIKVKSGE